MAKDFRIIVLISGRGSNLKSLIEQAQSFKIVGVLSNKPDAPGLEYARAAQLPIYSLDRKKFESLSAMKQALLKQCRDLKPDAVVLAGFMQILEQDFLAAFPQRVINIHPSLLPAYPGVDTHARVLAAKESEHGCSVHIVDGGVDTGPLIAQARCKCLPDDDVSSLSSRVLALEHRLFPWVINNIGSGEIDLNNGKPNFSAVATQQAQDQGFTIFKHS